MENLIRKISIGPDYKDNAMHYSIGQKMYGGHIISNILIDEKSMDVYVYLEKDGEIKVWKKFNSKMPVTIEYDLDYN